MNVQHLSGGIELHMGTPDAELIEAVNRTSIHSIRPADRDELMDCLMAMGFGVREISEQFGQLLSLCLGLHRSDCRYYAIMDGRRPLFVATLTQVGGRGGVCLMSGYGITAGYEKLSKRDIQWAITKLFDTILTDMYAVFGVGHAVCHVKSTNSATLLMWRYLARTRRDADIRITDDPFHSKSYKLVTVGIL